MKHAIERARLREAAKGRHFNDVIFRFYRVMQSYMWVNAKLYMG